ncbi:hypothetical protein [Paenibacillus dendritiformis]|uniref:hypothetical protein n=1 Tax=Paenibacillus dendritiformis TaxID=130049 RepID=UPI00387E17E0
MSNEGSVKFFVNTLSVGGANQVLFNFAVNAYNVSQTSDENRLQLYDNLVVALKIVMDNIDNLDKSVVDVYKEYLHKTLKEHMNTALEFEDEKETNK